ncbi:gamma carbonic anhydrase family protein [bacterium]|nr:gamma carbonic anhydrase family protein [bacterium]MBU1985007.1 gamma carbonic anhydrase family protein [bacterium]
MSTDGSILLPFKGILPRIHPTAWIAPGAVVIGDTEIGAESSVWFGCVIRGDVNFARIGSRVNIQDGAICHVNHDEFSLVIEDSVSVGHCVMLHGCRLERGCLIGIGARILDGVVVGSESLVAAGSVVREGTIIPAGELWAGIPAVKKRDLTPEARREILATADHYVQYRLHYMEK